MPDVEARFSPDYATARARFRAATQSAPIDVLDDYTLDWAWTGDRTAPDVLVVSSGLHGVEGYAGSAAQLEILSANPTTPTLWLHALNPWGMANFRRVNENNVDLNRNFLPPGEPYADRGTGYGLLDATLNPNSPPSFDFFLLQVGWLALRHGYGPMKNALMSGQHGWPKGLQYAGAALETGPAGLLRLLDSELSGKRRIVHLDLHCGRGAFATWTPLLDGGSTRETTARVRAAFGEGVKAWEPDDPLAYTIRGGLTGELGRRFAGTRYDGLTIEFGTYSDLKLLQCFRDENRATHWDAATPDHPARRALLEAFCPAAREWREAVLRHAPDIYARAERLLA